MMLPSTRRKLIQLEAERDGFRDGAAYAQVRIRALNLLVDRLGEQLAHVLSENHRLRVDNANPGKLLNELKKMKGKVPAPVMSIAERAAQLAGEVAADKHRKAA